MWVPKIFVLGISIANPSNTFGGILSHASKVTQLDLWSKVIMLSGTHMQKEVMAY